MRTICQALPVLAADPRLAGLAVDLTTFHRMLRDHSAGMGDMPTSVLTAAAEIIGTAPRKKRYRVEFERRRSFADLAITLYEMGYRPEPNDLLVAVGVWSVVQGRAVQVYRGLAIDAERAKATPRADQAAVAAATMCAFASSVAHDGLALMAEADTRRIVGTRERSVSELRQYVQDHPELRHVHKPPKSQVQLRLAVAG